MAIMTVVGKVELVTSEEANLANNASSSIANVPTDLGVDIGGGSGLPLTTPRVGETVDTQDPGAPGHKEVCRKQNKGGRKLKITPILMMKDIFLFVQNLNSLLNVSKIRCLQR